MEAFAMYFLKSVIWLTGFALVYFIFLQNERFFFLKRIYLVTGILVSFILPLFTFHYAVDVAAPILNTQLAAADPGSAPGVIQASRGKSFNPAYILIFLYLAGILFFMLKSAKQLRILIKTIKNSDIEDIDQARLIRASGLSGSFSFFNYVFINPSINDKEMEMIMNHELVHVTQKHWFDLLLVEIIRLFQWVNPFAWIYTGFIRQNHEYIADEAVLEHTANPAVYKAVLVNQLFGAKVISLSDSFNYSVNKKRFDMMKKIVSSPYRKVKVLLVLPVFAIVFYAFATPEYHYAPPLKNENATAIIYEPSLIFQKEIKGVVKDENGKALQGVNVASTGKLGNANMAITDSEGKFSLSNVTEDATIFFFLKSYYALNLKPDFKNEMVVKMEKDPNYKEPMAKDLEPKVLIVVDDVITETMPSWDQIATNKFLNIKEATEKYGEKGKNGAMEYMTLKRAVKQGIKVPFRRKNPEDFPTFQGRRFDTFNDWVVSQTKYPEEAKTKKIEGWVQLNFTIEPDGTISKIKSVGVTDPILSDAVVKMVQSAPKWEPAKNPEAREPFQSNLQLKFILPNQLVKEEPFVVVEEMPQYPGGDVELLKFIENNTEYPEAAKANKVEGKVIIRFVVNTDGNTEGISILKGVDPLLDAEAVRVIGMLSGFKPGMQNGKAVNVWYMAPVNFSLQKDTVK
jgi:TonB family protein